MVVDICHSLLRSNNKVSLFFLSDKTWNLGHSFLLLYTLLSCYKLRQLGIWCIYTKLLEYGVFILNYYHLFLLTDKSTMNSLEDNDKTTKYFE